MNLTLSNIGNGPAQNIILKISFNEKFLPGKYFEKVGSAYAGYVEDGVFGFEKLEVEKKYSAIRANGKECIDTNKINSDLNFILFACSQNAETIYMSDTRMEFDIEYSYEDLMGYRYNGNEKLYFIPGYSEIINNENALNDGQIMYLEMKVYLESMEAP